MELASSRVALVALGHLAAVLTSSLAGALAATVLLSTVALLAYQDLHPAAGAKEKLGRSVRGRHGGSSGWSFSHPSATDAVVPASATRQACSACMASASASTSAGSCLSSSRMRLQPVGGLGVVH